MIRLEAGAATLVGQVRPANEDAVLVADGLAAVADGMGGHLGGEVASAMTVEVLGGVAGSRSVQDLVAAVHRANRSVHEKAAENEDLRGMGTTACVAGLVNYEGEEQIAVLNVGDSRAYLLAEGELTRLTEDHSLVETLVREGRLTAEEAEAHPQRNVVTRALGIEPLVVVDAWLLDPADGDRLLLCSDGLFGEVDEERIRDLLAEGESPEVVARRLAEAADAAGGRDNISTVVVDVSAPDRPPAPVEGRYRRITTPAVDLSDAGDDGPRTDTVMAVVTTPGSDPDPGDVDEAAGSEPPEGAVEGTGGTEGDDRGHSRRIRWRSAVFVLAIVGVILLAVGALLIAAGQGFHVAEVDGRVAVFRGPASGVLWIEGALVETTEIEVDDLVAAKREDVEANKEFSTRSEVDRFIENLTTTTTTTTTTAPPTTTTTTTAPPPAALPPAAPPTNTATG